MTNIYCTKIKLVAPLQTVMAFVTLHVILLVLTYQNSNKHLIGVLMNLQKHNRNMLQVMYYIYTKFKMLSMKDLSVKTEQNLRKNVLNFFQHVPD